jgi:hypothetical protein
MKYFRGDVLRECRLWKGILEIPHPVLKVQFLVELLLVLLPAMQQGGGGIMTNLPPMNMEIVLSPITKVESYDLHQQLDEEMALYPVTQFLVERIHNHHILVVVEICLHRKVWLVNNLSNCPSSRIITRKTKFTQGIE